VDLPQYVFEVGDIVQPDENKETRTKQVSSLCGLKTDVRVNLTNMMTEIGFLLRGMALDGRFSFEVTEDPSFIKGRCANILVDKKHVGILGEISPNVLSNFMVGNPVIAFELELPTEGEW
jgi:phenylalanyl-tRNA synthetase beta chain